MTFFQPLYLIGLALMSVPVIFHLWFRRHMKTVPFSTLSFLKKVEARRLGWLRLRELLVLVTRVLFVGFLFLSLARPQVGHGFLVPNRRASVILILDNSASMGYADNFNRARRLADQLLSRYAEGSEILLTGLVMIDGETTFTWRSPRSARAAINQISLTSGTGSLRSVLERIGNPRPRWPLEYVYIGDGQESNFHNVFAFLPAYDRLYWLRVRSGTNVGIAGVHNRVTFRRRHDPYSLRVRLVNYAARQWRGRLEARHENFSVTQEVVLPASQEYEVSFDLPPLARQVEFRWLEDSLAFDNHYYYRWPEPDIVRVLLISPDMIIRRVLQPNPDTAGIFEVRISSRLAGIDLRGYDAVILDRVSDLTDAERRRLENFLIGPGRTVICLLGSELGPGLREFISAAAEPVRIMVPAGYATLDRIDYENPYFSVFEGRSALPEVKFHRWWQLRPHGKVAAYLRGGDPWIISEARRVIVTASADPVDSDLMYNSGFVPLVHRLVLGSITESGGRTFTVGDISPFTQPLTAAEGATVFPHQRFTRAGFYVAAGETVAVNVPTAEGNLALITKGIAHQLKIQEVDLNQPRGLGDLSKLALILGMAMILCEQILLII